MVSWLYVQDPYQKKQRGGLIRKNWNSFSSENLNRNLRYANFYHPAMSFGAWWNFNFCTRDSRELGSGAKLKLHPPLKNFLNGCAHWGEILKQMSSVAQNWWKHCVCFFAPDAENVGQEDPTVWIGYMCMMSISFFHSRISSSAIFFARIAFCGKVFAAIYLLANDPL